MSEGKDKVFIAIRHCAPFKILSICLVKDNGKVYFAINSESAVDQCQKYLKTQEEIMYDVADFLNFSKILRVSTDPKSQFLRFIGFSKYGTNIVWRAPERELELWSYNGSYEYVLLVDVLFKNSIEMRGFPDLCRNLHQATAQQHAVINQLKLKTEEIMIERLLYSSNFDHVDF